MRHLVSRLAAGLCAIVVLTAPAVAQFNAPIFATPLPPGPGTVALPIPCGPLVAPVLLPVGAPTAAPVAIYQYPPSPGAQAMTACDPGYSNCRTPGRTWVAADFLYGATQGLAVPPLVTASPNGTPIPAAGALYRPTTSALFGGQREGNSTRPGFRVTGGYWFDPALTRGVDATFFFLGDQSESFVGSSGPGGIILARPLVNGLTGRNFGLPVGGFFPGGIAGTVGTSFIGGDANYRRALVCNGPCRIDLLAGFRYLHLGDDVNFWQTGGLPAAVPGLFAPAPAGALVHDSIRTRNNFYGPQLGLTANWQMPWRMNLQLWTKLAMGVTGAYANADGMSFLPGGVMVPTGVLVQPSNAGAYRSSYFAVVPEAGLKLGYNLTDAWRFNVGYTFLYWSKVRRAAEQIDLTTLAPGRPAFRSETTDVWMQAWSAGLQYRF